MKLESLKDLEAAIKLCRKLGVDSLEVNGVKVQLGLEPVRAKKAKGGAEEIADEPTYTDEQLLFWSTQGAPEGLNGQDN